MANKERLKAVISGNHHQPHSELGYHKSGDRFRITVYRPDAEKVKIRSLDGYRILLNDIYSNLGWRILVECEGNKGVKDLLAANIGDYDKRIYDYLPKAFIDQHTSNLELLQKVKNDGEITHKQQGILEKFFGAKIDNLRAELTTEEDAEEAEKDQTASSENISVILTTYVGCKGIAADYIFVVGLNERNLPKNNSNPSNMEICKFIVALTRTIRKCYLVSVSRFAGKSEGNRSIFIDWIDKKRIKTEQVNAQYWKTSAS